MSTVKKITWIQPYYDLVLNEVPVEAQSVLDVGAGYGIFGSILKKSREASITAIEPFGYDLSHYNHAYQQTWEGFFHNEKQFGFKYDVLVSTEMVEHMSKENAQNFLIDAKLRANKVIIATPFKWEQQEAYDGNEFQIHRCLMTMEDFEKNDYKVKVLGTITKKGLTARIYCHPKWIKLLKPFGFKPTNIIGVWSK